MKKFDAKIFEHLGIGRQTIFEDSAMRYCNLIVFYAVKDGAVGA